ncbi:hypothetical protein JW948_03825 [bacterium]|nr:hypothetical protein [bacterium]
MNRKKTILPAWALSLIALLAALVLLMLTANVLGSVMKDRDLAEEIAYIVHDVFLGVICYLICRKYPKSVWYVPVICNMAGIVSAVVEPNFWITPLWIFIGTGWILSVTGALCGAKAGRRLPES